MILQAIERGVNEERLAKALHLDIKYVKSKINLLNRICPEAVELLKNRERSSQVFPFLRKMKTFRQIECTELMVSLNNVTTIYATASPVFILSIARADKATFFLLFISSLISVFLFVN